MIENLRAIRGVHRILLITCAAITGFALAPDSITALRKAESEAATLRNVRWNEYSQFLQGKPDAADNTDLVLLKRVMSKERIPFAPDVNLAGRPFYCDVSQPEVRNLAEVEMFLDQLHWIQPIRIKTPESAIEKEMRGRILPLQPNETITQLRFAPLDSQMNPCGPYDPVQQYSRARIDFTVSPSDGSPSQFKSIEILFEPRDSRLERQFALQWFQSLPNAKELTSKDELFPGMKVYWDEIANKAVPDALQELSEREATAKGKLAFFGLSVDRRAAGWIAPLVLLLVLSFLIAHMRHALKHSNSLTKPQEVASYPWVGIFGGIPGSILAYASISAAPIVAVLWMIIRSPERALGQPSYAIALDCLVFVGSLWASYELYFYRSKLAILLNGKNLASSR